MMASPVPEGKTFDGPVLSPDRAWLAVAYARMGALATDRLPQMVDAEGASPQESWAVIRLAFLARMNRTAAALGALVPFDPRLDAIALARNLLEHVIVFAWVAAEPDERFEQWLAADYSGRLDYAKGGLLSRGRRRKSSAWPQIELDPDDVRYYRAFVKRVQQRPPGLPRMAEEADDTWLDRYPAGLANHERLSLVRLYEDVYDSYSWLSHPHLTGLQSFWEWSRQWTVVHAQETAGREHDPLHMGVLLHSVALLITSLSFGLPDTEDVVSVMNSNADLSLAQREGRMHVRSPEPGRFEISVDPASDSNESA